MSTRLTDVRPSPIAGAWYPGAARPLRRDIEGYLDAAQVAPPPGAVVALVAPHAGYMYSGPVAGHAFALVRGAHFKTVVVVSPMHQYYDAPVLTSAHQAYGTPLGAVPINAEALAQLSEQVEIKPVRYDREHSLEIELPFLQVALGDFDLIPLMMREQSVALAQALGAALAAVLEALPGPALLVASSDLSHFYPQAQAEKLAAVMLERIGAVDPVGVIEAEEQRRGFACGRAAIATVLFAARALGADSAQVLRYATSGDVSGDYSQVVGYGAAVVYKSEV